MGDIAAAVASICWLNHSGTAAEVPKRVPMTVWDGVLASLPLKGETSGAIIAGPAQNCVYAVEEMGQWAAWAAQYGPPFTPLGSPTAAAGCWLDQLGEYALTTGMVHAGTGSEIARWRQPVTVWTVLASLPSRMGRSQCCI